MKGERCHPATPLRGIPFSIILAVHGFSPAWDIMALIVLIEVVERLVIMAGNLSAEALKFCPSFSKEDKYQIRLVIPRARKRGERQKERNGSEERDQKRE